MIYFKIFSAFSPKRSWHCVLFTGLLSFTLTACDQRTQGNTSLESVDAQVARASVNNDELADSGVKLLDVAGQATLPPQNQVLNNTRLSEQALDLVGRYYIRLSCKDNFAKCEGNEGEVEYILNLLDDGSVYRKRISIGRLKVDESQNTELYRQDHWSYDASQHEITVQINGKGRYFLDVLPAKDQLIVNAEKTRTADGGQNKLKFGEHYILPSHNYVLTRLE